MARCRRGCVVPARHRTGECEQYSDSITMQGVRPGTGGQQYYEPRFNSDKQYQTLEWVRLLRKPSRLLCSVGPDPPQAPRPGLGSGAGAVEQPGGREGEEGANNDAMKAMKGMKARGRRGRDRATLS